MEIEEITTLEERILPHGATLYVVLMAMIYRLLLYERAVNGVWVIVTFPGESAVHRPSFR